MQLQSTFVDTRGAVVATETSTLGVGRFEAGRTVDYFVTIPLATLAPGDYLLKIEATMGTRVARRAMRFGIKP